MPTHVFYGYSPTSLVFDGSTGSFTLDPDFVAADRVRFEVTDDDNFLDGDEHNNEVGEDSNQTGIVTTTDGTVISSGLIYGEQYAVLQAPDGSNVTIDRIEIAGQHMGYIPSEPLQPGVAYTYVGGADIDNSLASMGGADTRLSYPEYETLSVPCFGSGTMIQTPEGEIPVEWLQVSDMVLTRDHGYQPVLWVGRRRLPQTHFSESPEDRPVRIPAGSLAAESPTRDLILTGDHRVLIESAIADVVYQSSEVFAPAKAWVDAGMATSENPEESVTFTHLLCASHEVIFANGAWVESMFTGVETLRRLGPADVQELESILGPELHNGTTARPCLTRKEALTLLSSLSDPREIQTGEKQARTA